MNKHQRAILLLNAMLRERCAEQRSLCRKFPRYAKETEMPDGSVLKGGMLEDLEALEYALDPSGAGQGKTLVDLLDSSMRAIGAEMSTALAQLHGASETNEWMG